MEDRISDLAWTLKPRQIPASKGGWPAASLGNLSDEALAAEASRGSEDHWRSIVKRYSGPLYRAAYRLVGDAAGAEDVLQDTFISIFRFLPRADLARPLRPWFYKILMNTAKTHLKRARRTGDLMLSEAAAPLPTENSIEAADARLDLQAALARLPIAYRQVIVLRTIEELPFAEVADILGVPEPTARTRYHRARRLLAGNL